MKKLFTLSLIVASIAVLSNCSPKTGKKVAKTETKSETKSEAKTEEAPPSAPLNVADAAQGNRTNQEQVEMLSQVNEKRLENGKALYESTCNKCHELHNPGSRSAESWVEIMKTMGVKAKLEQGPYMMISSYLIKHAKG